MSKGTIGYHVRVLREAGLVQPAETRQVRGGTEQYFALVSHGFKMPLARARVATACPARYVKQLVARIGHNADAARTSDGRGTITLASGTCTLTPTTDRLELTATAVDAESLTRVQDVITRHLVRFAAQEELRDGVTIAQRC
ncbi:DUF2218 domain-containing protein [Streptomyces platensis]|uniref:DUF2218 domain-containing protein n=1 Tax=Streptomyces platensis TaxID=58346 RepID=UPI0030E51139